MFLFPMIGGARAYHYKVHFITTLWSNLHLARFQAKLKFPSWTECGNNWITSWPKLQVEVLQTSIKVEIACWV